MSTVRRFSVRKMFVLATSVLAVSLGASGLASADASWQATQTLASPTDGKIFDQVVGTAADGSSVVVWGQFNSSSQVVKAQKIAADGTSGAVVTLSNENESIDSVHISVAANGSAIASWYERSAGIYYLKEKRLDANGTWDSSATTLATSSHYFESETGISDTGNAVVVWSRNVSDTLISVEATTVSASGAVGTTTTLSTGNTSRRLDVDMSGNGSAIATWSEVNSSSKYVIRTKRMSTNGSWDSTAINLSNSSNNNDYPQVAMGDNGNAVVVWQRSTYSYLYGITLSAGNVPGSAYEAISDDVPSGFDYTLDVAPSGTAVVTWSNNYLYAKFMSAAGVWGENVLLSSDFSLADLGMTRDSSFAFSPSGKGVAVWVELRYDVDTSKTTSERVYTKTMSSDGTWESSPGTLFASENLNYDETIYSPRIAFGAGGQGQAVWSYLPSGDYSDSSSLLVLKGARYGYSSASEQPSQGVDATDTVTAPVESQGIEGPQSSTQPAASFSFTAKWSGVTASKILRKRWKKAALLLKLSGAAKVRFKVFRVKAKKKKQVATFLLSGKQGTNRVFLSKKIKRRLSAGKYQLQITATSNSSNISKTKRLNFRVSNK